MALSCVGYVEQAYVVDKATYNSREDVEEQSDEEQWSEGTLLPTLHALLQGPVPSTPCSIQMTSLMATGTRLTRTSSSIDYISDHRKRGRTQEYLVVWEGYSEDEATWEPAGNIPQTNSALKTYLDAL